MLTQFSDQLADVVATVAPSVVQVHGSHRPASGVVFDATHVVTTMRVVGRDDKVRVRRHDGTTLDGQLTAFDPASRIALVEVPDLGAPALQPAAAPPRVGQVAIAVARSWSNAVTVTGGLLSVIGGPLRTGRRRSIEQVIRVSAPMHEGFAGGALVDTAGNLVGITTAAAIRGLGVVIPSGIAWASARALLEGGLPKQGHLGIGVQVARVSQSQASVSGRETAMLVMAVVPGSPAEAAGLLVGDLLLAIDGRTLEEPDDLVDALRGNIVGKATRLDLLRGDSLTSLTATVAERR
jgi:S1-C subfamily serine protease